MHVKVFSYLNFVENVKSREKRNKSDHFIQHQVVTANSRQVSLFQLNIANKFETEQVIFRNMYV